MPISIVTDSACDLPAETVASLGIQVVPLYINVGSQGYLDGIDMTRQAFYEQLPNFPAHPTTAVPSPAKFRAVYDALAEAGASQVLSIHLSKALSAIVDVARSAAQETRSVVVTVVDSGQLSLGAGFQVELAARMAAAGETADEIIAALEALARRIHVFAALDTLEYLRRSGRMNRFMSGLGSLMQIKPIMKMHAGQPSSERVRTSERAVKRLLELLEGAAPFERVAILHTHAAQRVAELRARAAHLLPTGDLLETDITPVIGVHIGPNAAGFALVSAR